LRCIDFEPSRRWVVVGGDDGNFHVYELSDDWVNSKKVFPLPDGRGQDTSSNAAETEELKPHHDDYVRGVSFIQGEKGELQVLSVGDDKAMKLWDADNGFVLVKVGSMK
jgi:WD40 repeat protein